MRLINVETYELKEFFSEKTPPYAILSHTWGTEEVTFQDWARLKDESTKGQSTINQFIKDQSAKGRSIKDNAGFQKIQEACRQAKKDNLEWLWCDTNCIDKRSSAELSEAINSMFAWYRDSHICYAYLADVDVRGLQMSDTPMNRGFSSQSQNRPESIPSNTIHGKHIVSKMSKSRWFTRGWTLQELLAPSHEVFFASGWTVLGDRNSMAKWIADITGIHIGALKDRSIIHRYSIAQRMSWAATRETTRSEDIAYCLLGIFNIHMPMLYGEGSAAFIRLQKEIMKTSDDHSIFSWELQDSERGPLTGALATTPKAFLSCSSVVRDDDIGLSPFAVTNLGVSMNLWSIQSWYGSIISVGLNCAKELRGCDDPLSALHNGRTFCRRFQAWIFLCRVEYDIYQRVHLPASTVFFQHFYYSSVKMTKTALFIEIHKSPTRRPLPLPAVLVPPIRKSIQDYPLTSGLTITFGWGTVNRLNRFEQTFDLGQFCSQTLKGQSRMGTSHQLVSSPTFTLLLSITWDEHIQAHNCTHSIFAGPAGMFSGRIIDAEQRKRLFDGIPTTGDIGDLVGLTLRIHNQLRHDFANAFQHARCSPITPVVVFSPQGLQNLHGQREVVVDILFKENQEPMF